jgi:predicted transcriptional regulator
MDAPETENPETDKNDKVAGKQISSRGVPSEESVYLPRHDSDELRSFQDRNENITRNSWNVDEVANFIFSKKYQPKYYEVALGFLKLLSERTELNGEEIASYVKTNGISKATFYNRVLPRLKRVGMIKVERDTIVAIESKRKFRPMRISLSKTFGNYFMKIGDSWLAIVDDARSRKEKKDQMKL